MAIQGAVREATPARFEIIRSAALFYSRLFSDIEAARESVLIQMYMVDEDNVGLEFSSLLRKKAAQGLRVVLIYDSVGSMNTPTSFFDRMIHDGVAVTEHHPVNPGRAPGPFSIRALMRRNHRKLAVLDNKIYYLGGMNIGERFLDWEDITVRGEGNTAAVLAQTFAEPAKGSGRPRPPKFRELAAKRIQVCDSRPRFQNYPMKRMHLTAIKKARERIWIAQAYFIPRSKIVKALIRAAQRGVDVRIVAPDRSDVMVADLAAWVPMRRLMRHGVKVLRYTAGMLHSKFTVIDADWVTTGTANLDSMSIYWNLETNLVIRDGEIAGSFARIFEDYQAKSRLVDADEPANRSWTVRLVGRMLYHYSWLL
jgi:cardiolipin synthase